MFWPTRLDFGLVASPLTYGANIAQVDLESPLAFSDSGRFRLSRRRYSRRPSFRHHQRPAPAIAFTRLGLDAGIHASSESIEATRAIQSQGDTVFHSTTPAVDHTVPPRG